MSDGFNAGTIDSSLWTTEGAAVNANCGANSESTALRFDRSNDRYLESKELPKTAVALSLFLKFGKSDDGFDFCANAEEGEDVILQFSFDGGSSWQEFARFDTLDFPDFTKVEEDIPAGATNFRLEQVGPHLFSGDNWAIDDIEIYCRATDFCGTSVLGCDQQCCDASQGLVGPACCGSTPFDPLVSECCYDSFLIPEGELCPEACADTCDILDSDGILEASGIAVCTFDDKGGEPLIDDDEDDQYRNYCETDSSQFPLIPGVSEADGRPVFYCGCCDEAEVGGLDKIKRSKKSGEHCTYDATVRRGLKEEADVGTSMRGTSSKVSRGRFRSVE